MSTGCSPRGTTASTRAEAARVRAAARHIGDIQLRYTTLLGRLGRAFDGPGQLTDADAWYFILEGTREPSVAEAQALAITELAARAATSPAGPQRAILLAADDYSAVSRRVPLSNLYERGRSLGIGVQVSAQTWQGLGRDDDERYRIAATADGGLWVMHTPYPEPLCELAGARRVLETAHKLIGNSWGDEGTTRLQHAWTADPDLIRRMTTGQACYISHGSATFVQVARPRPSPLTLCPHPSPPSLPPGRPPPARHLHRRPASRPPVSMTTSDPEPHHDLQPVRDPRPAHPPRPGRRTGPRRLAGHRHRHPPRPPDGGDPAWYAQASAAYAQLNSGWGRSEAYADLLEAQNGGTIPLPFFIHDPAPARRTYRPLRLLPSRIVHGRPLRLLIRAAAAPGCPCSCCG